MPTRVKICGVKRPEDIEAAVSAGADAVGLVVGYPKSPRNLEPSVAAELRRRVPVFVDAVLVTRADRQEELRRLCGEIGPDAVQLYGDLPYEAAREAVLGARLIKPINASAMLDVAAASRGFDAVLLDSWGAELPGGSGQRHDWSLSRRIRELIDKPLILAGGLTPENVSEAIRTVRPFAVDVSSGVESAPGVKDRELIRRFIAEAKGVEE